VTDPNNRRSTPSGRLRRWAAVGLVLAGSVLVAIIALVVVQDRHRPNPPSRATSSAGVAPSSDLVGEWSGQGSVTRCAGLDDEVCSGTRSVTLSIACPGKRCVVTPFDRSYGSPPLRLEDGAYVAVGPLPADVAPTCDGVPTTSGRWRLELTARDGRLVGTYEESTIQGFDCGATGVGWSISLERA
jgi:hypothetical protein